MDNQRSSALQQRLQARRDMFFNKEGVAQPAPPAATTPTYAGSRGAMGALTTPSQAPPQPPNGQPTKNVKDALNILNSRGSDSSGSSYGSRETTPATYATNGVSSAAKPKPEVAPKPRDVSPKPDATKKVKILDGAYVGFANLPNQVYRKAVKRGFEFTLMVVGETGLGKSTLINSMFLTDVYSKDYPGPSQRLKKTVQVETNKVMLKEGGVNLTLTIVDTPGFGDAVDNSNCWESVMNNVESQYESFLEAETKVNRNPAMPDSRVHACLYFIAPSGHGLKPLDIEFMKQLHDKVNIIPIIAKADTLTPEEVEFLKTEVMKQIHASKIKIYEFPEFEEGEEDAKKENQKMKDRVPFAVVGSNTMIEGADGKKVRGRRYPWGVVDIENLEHCDFVPLRNMLIRTHLQDLKDVTNSVHYENFRCRKLAGVAGSNMNDKLPNKNPLAMIEEEQKEHVSKLSKMEREMEEVFERKVREKKQKLADNEADLERRQKESTERLEQHKREYEEKQAAFIAERASWEELNNVTIEDLKRLSMESLDGKKKKGLSGVSFRMGR